MLPQNTKLVSCFFFKVYLKLLTSLNSLLIDLSDLLLQVHKRSDVLLKLLFCFLNIKWDHAILPLQCAYFTEYLGNRSLIL